MLAIIVSSVAIVPIYLVFLIFTGELDNMLLMVVLVAALGVTSIAVLFVGLPVHMILVRLDRVKSLNYAIAGFVVPVIVTLAFQPFGNDGLKWIAIQSVFLGILGVLIALIFWKVVTYETAK